MWHIFFSTQEILQSFLGSLCDNWKPSFLPLLIFNWRTFSRWVTARWKTEDWKKDNMFYVNKYINLNSLVFFKETFCVFNLCRNLSILIPNKDLHELYSQSNLKLDPSTLGPSHLYKAFYNVCILAEQRLFSEFSMRFFNIVRDARDSCCCLD